MHPFKFNCSIFLQFWAKVLEQKSVDTAYTFELQCKIRKRNFLLNQSSQESWWIIHLCCIVNYIALTETRPGQYCRYCLSRALSNWSTISLIFSSNYFPIRTIFNISSLVACSFCRLTFRWFGRIMQHIGPTTPSPPSNLPYLPTPPRWHCAAYSIHSRPLIYFPTTSINESPDFN